MTYALPRLASLAALTLGLVATHLPTLAADEHHAMHGGKDIAAFHDALAPLWHAKGQARIDNACAQADKLGKLAKDIQNQDASLLQEAVAVFGEKCKSAPAEAEAAFGKVHDAFHHLAMRMGEKGKTGEHQH